MKRSLIAGILLAPLAPFALWVWAVSMGYISTEPSFGVGLGIAGVLFLMILYAATIVILVPLVLVLARLRRLSVPWVVGTATAIGLEWRFPLDLFFVGVQDAIRMATHWTRDQRWEGLYAFVLATALCLITGVPLRGAKRGPGRGAPR